MKNRIILLIMVLLIPFASKAQWRAGVTGGAAYNVFSMDKQYMTDLQVDGCWGATMGVSVQYDIYTWLALRTDLNITQKNYRKYRVILSSVDYWYQNDYLQLPVMASFSFGGQRVRGFCNLGVYGGYWLHGYKGGSDFDSFRGHEVSVSEDVRFNPVTDQRWDFGFLGGIGMEYKIAYRWAARAEALCYYSTVSTTLQYMRVKDYRYNTTAAFQLGACYLF